MFHGALRGEKVPALSGPVVLSAVRMVAEIPSHFTHPERACPATTFFRSAMVHGHVAEVVDPVAKACALQALMVRFQPEGGHRPIVADDPLYTRAIAGVRVWAVTPDRVVAKAALGRGKPRAWQERALAGLWRQGSVAAVRELAAVWELGLGEAPGALRLVLPGPEHLEELCGLLHGQYWMDGISEAVARAAHRDSPAWVGALDSHGRLVATARAVADGARLAHVMDVAVHPDHRGRGVGTALLRLLMDHPSVRGCRVVSLRTRDAGPFYARLGFTRAPGRADAETWVRRAGGTAAPRGDDDGTDRAPRP